MFYRKNQSEGVFVVKSKNRVLGSYKPEGWFTWNPGCHWMGPKVEFSIFSPTGCSAIFLGSIRPSNVFWQVWGSFRHFGWRLVELENFDPEPKSCTGTLKKPKFRFFWKPIKSCLKMSQTSFLVVFSHNTMIWVVFNHSWGPGSTTIFWAIFDTYMPWTPKIALLRGLKNGDAIETLGWNLTPGPKILR